MLPMNQSLLLLVMSFVMLTSCGTEAPREIFPASSHNVGIPDLSNDQARKPIDDLLKGIVGVKSVEYEKDSASLHLSDGGVLKIIGFREREYKSNNSLAMLCGQSSTNLKSLAALALKKSVPPPDLLKAIHMDPSRIKEVAFYQSSDQSGNSLFALFLGQSKGMGDPDTTAIYILPKK
jgi:hypothetical protein